MFQNSHQEQQPFINLVLNMDEDQQLIIYISMPMLNDPNLWTKLPK